MQAYRIHQYGIPLEESKRAPLRFAEGDYAACGYLNAACTSSVDELFGGDKRSAISGLPGRARRSSPYLSSSPIYRGSFPRGTFNRPRGSRRRRRDA